MVLLIEADRETAYAEWRDLFREFMPADCDIRWWNDPDVDPRSVEAVFCFNPEHGRLAQFPNLRVICSASVGVERIVADQSWSRAIPLVRMGCPETTTQMADYVAWACLSEHLVDSDVVTSGNRQQLLHVVDIEVRNAPASDLSRNLQFLEG